MNRGRDQVDLSYRVMWNECGFSASCPERNLHAHGSTVTDAVNALRLAARTKSARTQGE